MGTSSPREERTGAGLMLMCLAVTLFTCIDTSAKWLLLFGLPTLQVVFTRYLGHFLLALVVYLPTEGRSALVSNAPLKQALRSGFLLGSTVMNFMALRHLPITITTTIFFAGPIVTSILAIPILGEKVGLRRLIAICFGFSGVLVVVQPWGTEFHPSIFFSLAGLMCASLYFIMTRLLAGVEANSTQQIWGSGTAVLCLLPFSLQEWVWPDTTQSWIVFCLIGAFGFGGHAIATLAHRWADASLLAPVVYIQVFLASLAGVLVFDTWPTIWTLVGGAIIIASGLYIWQRERAVNRR